MRGPETYNHFISSPTNDIKYIKYIRATSWNGYPYNIHNQPQYIDPSDFSSLLPRLAYFGGVPTFPFLHIYLVKQSNLLV